MCSTGGEGFGVATHTIPDQGRTKTIVNSFTFTYGGLSHGVITGKFVGDYYSGTVAFQVLEVGLRDQSDHQGPDRLRREVTTSGLGISKAGHRHRPYRYEEDGHDHRPCG